MATSRKRTAPVKTSVKVTALKVSAQRTVDDEFLALLRKQCLSAATVGALTAAGELIPGLGRVLGMVFGELLDAKILATIQRELIEKTFDIYGLKLPEPVHEVLVGRVQMLGTSASIAGDAIIRQLLKRSVGGLGTFVVARVIPLTSIASSAFSNAMVTYAVGKRAQALGKLHDEPFSALPDALRAFGGIDERRVLDWTVEGVKTSLSLIGKTLRGMVQRIPAGKSQKRGRASAT